MRIFADTNVLASSLATRGLCADLFEYILNTQQLLTCQEVLDELRRILLDKFHIPKTLVRDYLILIQAEAERVEAGELTVSFPQNPDDARILAYMVAGRADVFVTGDGALLELTEIEGIPQLSPRQLWETLGQVV